MILNEDYKGTVFKNLYNLKLMLQCNIHTPLILISSYLKSIKIGSNNKFYGITYFYRKPGSKITIADNNEFRSSQHSNLIGINRRCSISTISGHARIDIGNNCGFSGTVIGAEKKIEIGNKVMCGANTLITDSDWHGDDPRSGSPKPVVIGNNVWLGVNSVVLKGVSIGENSVIGANSVVVKDIPADVVAAGNPCKVIKKLDGKHHISPTV